MARPRGVTEDDNSGAILGTNSQMILSTNSRVRSVGMAAGSIWSPEPLVNRNRIVLRTTVYYTPAVVRPEAAESCVTARVGDLCVARHAQA